MTVQLLARKFNQRPAERPPSSMFNLASLQSLHSDSKQQKSVRGHFRRTINLIFISRPARKNRNTYYNCDSRFFPFNVSFTSTANVTLDFTQLDVIEIKYLLYIHLFRHAVFRCGHSSGSIGGHNTLKEEDTITMRTNNHSTPQARTKAPMEDQDHSNSSTTDPPPPSLQASLSSDSAWRQQERQRRRSFLQSSTYYGKLRLVVYLTCCLLLTVVYFFDQDGVANPKDVLVWASFNVVLTIVAFLTTDVSELGELIMTSLLLILVTLAAALSHWAAYHVCTACATDLPELIREQFASPDNVLEASTSTDIYTSMSAAWKTLILKDNPVKQTCGVCVSFLTRTDEQITAKHDFFGWYNRLHKWGWIAVFPSLAAERGNLEEEEKQGFVDVHGNITTPMNQSSFWTRADMALAFGMYPINVEFIVWCSASLFDRILTFALHQQQRTTNPSPPASYVPSTKDMKK